MGGIGAAKLGFANPDKYSAIGILSGGPMDPSRNLVKWDAERFAWLEQYMLGPTSEMAGTSNDVFHNFLKLPQSGYPMPLLYDACGTADYIYPRFLEFREFARSAGMEQDVIFEEEPGEVHCWDFWDAYIARFVDRLPLKNRNFWRKWHDSQM